VTVNFAPGEHRSGATDPADANPTDPDEVARLRAGLANGQVGRMPSEIVVKMSTSPAGVMPQPGDLIVDPVLLAEATGEESGVSHAVIGLEVVMVDDTPPDAVYLTVIRLVEGTEGPASF
jgi:hypothetical protein